MSNNKHWIEYDNIWSFQNIPSVHKTLKPGVYELKESKSDFYLYKISDNFKLPEKIYGTERTFIDRIKTTYNGLDKNFGVLLKGLKGTGKTITAKIVSNELNLPVILINEFFPQPGVFINSIEQDVIILFDEFEKIYDFHGNDDSDQLDDNGNRIARKNVAGLLTLMDGVFTSKYKRLFLLTTNKDYLPDALLARPSRIRYIKDFNDLKYDAIVEILTNTLVNKDHIEPIVNLLKRLTIITIDIVKEIAVEVNIHNEVSEDFFAPFNLKREEVLYSIYITDSQGKAIKISGDRTRELENWIDNTFAYKDHYYVIDTINDFKGIGRFRAVKNSGETKWDTCEFLIEEVKKIHKSFDLVA